jgi:RNA polymerase sigma factor (sigma-70 family)
MCTQTHKVGGPSSSTEATQFQQAQAGCCTSLNELMERHDGLVQAVVRQQVLGDLPFTEAVQAGRIGLWHAIQGFDPCRGLAFSTYAWPSIMRQIWREVKAHARFSSPSAIGDEHSPANGPDPATVWEAKAVRQALRDAVRRLSQRLQYIIVARYGLNGDPPAIYRLIGADLGLAGERIRQLHTEALVWLRHPAHSYVLRGLLDRHTLEEYEGADDLAQQWLRWRGGRRGC